jgi:hypothetical protein
MLRRAPSQARDGFDIPGITKEVCFSDYFARRGGCDSDDDASFRLDRAQYQSAQSETAEMDATEAAAECDDVEMLSLSSVQHDDNGTDVLGSSQDANRMQVYDRLSEAMQTLTDIQAIAIWMWASGWSERDAAEYMGISQPAFHEVLHGKDGVGGVMLKFSKYFRKHPIT